MTDRPHLFREGDPRTVEAARKGARRRHAGLYPYDGTILDLADAAGLTDASWQPWRAILSAIDGLPLSGDGLAFYRRHTGRQEPPEKPVREFWGVAGRRGGKSRNMALMGVHRAIKFDPSTLAPGETPIVMLLAGDKRQAEVVFSYVRALCELRAVSPYVDPDRVLRSRIELKNGVVIEVHRSHYASVRGHTVIAAILDELAFWPVDENGANPDSETVRALKPALLTVPGSLLMAISSPYACKGELWRAHEKYFGVEDERVLVLNADTRSLNPTISAADLADEFDRDPVSALSEFGDHNTGRCAFRSDVAAFLDAAAVQAVTPEGRREIRPRAGAQYIAFTDPSGGRGDSFTLAIAHAEDGHAVLDCIRERKPPFSPDDVVSEFAAVLKSYGVRSVTADCYAGEWTVERFERHGITLEASDNSKSDIYMEFLPLVNAATCELLDLPVLMRQLVGLERRTARGGRDSVDHPRGARDDVANAAAGALVLAAPQAWTGKVAKLIA